MALESSIFDWSRTVGDNAPIDTDPINSGTGGKYTNLGEMFRDLKQVIRDQSLSHGWGTINNRTYFVNTSADATDAGMTFYRGTTDENHWGDNRTIRIKFSGQVAPSSAADTKYYVSTASGNGPVPRYLPTGTQFLIYNNTSPSKTWLFGYIHKIRTGVADSIRYLEILPSGLMEYSTSGSSIALPEDEVGLKPVANYNTALGFIGDGSYMVLSNHQPALPAPLNSGLPLEKTTQGGSGVGIANSLVESDDSFATSGSIGNTPSRKQSGVFVVTSGYSNNQGTASELDFATTGKRILVTLPVSAATNNPPAANYGVFLTPVYSVCKDIASPWGDVAISPLCYVVQDIKRYTTGFTVEFVAELPPPDAAVAACIVWKWMIVRDLS